MIDPDTSPRPTAGAWTDAWRMRRPDPSGRLSPPPDRRGAALGALLALAPLALAAAAPAGAGSPALKAGLRLHGRLAPGEVRRYPVALHVGDLLRVVVTEEGIDVDVRLLDPEGHKVAHVDGPTHPKEDEDLVAVAARDGRYQLEVEASRAHPTGGFALCVADLRPAGERDRLRAEAVRLTQEADERMRPDDTADGYRRQLADRERALVLWRGLGDRRRMAMALLRAGELHFNLEEYERAAWLLHQSADGFRIADDQGGLAEALNEAGRADRKLWRPAEAAAHFEAALPLARAAGDAELEIDLLDNFGNTYADLGRSREARDLLETARAQAHDDRDPKRESRILINLGSANANLGERQEALRLYRQALDIAVRAGLTERRAEAWYDMAETHELLGQGDKALEEYRQALRLFHQLEARRPEAWSLISVAQIELSQHHCADAAKDLARAVDLAPAARDRASEASSRAHLAIAEICLEHTARALREAEAARQVAPPGNDVEGEAWYALGAAHRAAGDMHAADPAFSRARDLFSARHNRPAEIKTTLLLARTKRDLGDLGRAAELAQRAVDIIESLRTRVAAGDLRASFLASKQEYYDFAIDTLMALARARPGAGHAAQALAMAEQARARSLLDLLATAGTEPWWHADPELVRRERQAREEVSAAEFRRQDLPRREAPPAEIAAAQGRLDRALADYEQVEAELADKSPSDASLTSPRPLAAAEIERRLLDSDTLLLEFSLGEPRSFLWVISQRGLTSYELPGRSKVTDAAHPVYSLITARNQAPAGESLAARQARVQAADRQLLAASEALSRMLLAPAAAQLGGHRLAIVPDGALQYIPFIELPDPAHPGELLVASHEVVSLPSASALAVQRRELGGRQPAWHLLALLADPVFSRDDERVATAAAAPPRLHPIPTQLLGGRAAGNGRVGPRHPPSLRGPAGGECGEGEGFPRLRFSRHEAEAIQALAIQAQVPARKTLVLTGFDASRDAVLSGRLADYRILHFATHGCIDSRSPALSKLVLSLVDRRGQPQNGFLRLADIYGLDLRADLVVLSACRTALGREMPGEGLIGLTRGFLHAGAARVLASLWGVDDRATAKLMERFYRGLLVEKRTPAAALRAAQLSMAQERLPPYYWAGFSLEGEWR